MSADPPLAEEALGPRATSAVGLVRRHLGELSPEDRDEMLRRLRARMASRRRGGVTWRAAAAALATAGAMAALAVVIGRHHGRSAAMSFRVEGAELLPGNAVEAGPSGRPVVRFSDGSEIAIAEGGRAHVRATDDRGAQVTLDEGRAHAYVVHAPGTRWSFDAGPFEVAVTGTAFGISWAPPEQRLDVRLENGAVTVSGPVFETPLALRAGQWLTVRSRDVLIRDLGAGDGDLRPAQTEGAQPVAAPAPRPSAAPPSAQGRPSRRAAAPASTAVPSSAQAAGRTWSADLAEGRFAAIVEDALRLGLERSLTSASSDDLAALADAARYTRRNDVARAASLAERRRFPSSEHARVAAFSLGRVLEAERSYRVALSWFETYLMEAPDGVFASEALGRKMVLVQQLDGNEAARPLAESYLRRFPGGAYARAAQSLTVSP